MKANMSVASAIHLAVLGLALLSVAPIVRAAEVGTIEKLSGKVSVVSVAKQTRPARAEEAVHEGETVVTDAGAEALIRIRDRSTFALRQNTQFRIGEFRYEEKPSDSMFVSLLKGAVRSVSGLIAKAQPRQVAFTTPNATIGIRGTDYEVVVLAEGSTEGRAGTYNYVYDGQTNLAVATGEALDVKGDQTGFAPEKPAPGEAPVQLLREKPAFLRGGGFDALMMQLSTQPMRALPPMYRGR